jgi:aminopeptidase N
MNQKQEPQAIFLKDYSTPEFTLKDISLTFDLDPKKTIVSSKMNIESKKEGVPLLLNGEKMKLLEVKINGKVCDPSNYQVDEEKLIIGDVPKNFTLEIQNEISPIDNTSLDGLYKSGGIYCTQCESHGFRKITYSFDRPDVMTTYTTKIIAKKSDYPLLLSNGNKIGSGDMEDGKHWAEWHDPFPKPTYLFALVAGDLGVITDSFTTMSGRNIDLLIYCDKGNEDKCPYAMESLKKSMKWDEDKFGREYDLDIFMIVAVDSFNMGAMENKGLNIFNSICVLAKQETATDNDFMNIEAVVGHEYFHNWTGNRITCRDWFQLTLKEGLTVFRDQEFSGDMNSRSVQRINDVIELRGRQFAEDAGPSTHPIKPESYIEMNNFYTATVYEKGAEVIRMVHTILGEEGFRKGMDHYFEKYDGQAITTEDFISAFHESSGVDFSQFLNWYSTHGTPEVEAKWDYNSAKKQLKLDLKQSLPYKQTKLLHLPIKVGLIDESGVDYNLPNLENDIIHFKEGSQQIVFENISSKPLVSLNRNFSTPIKLKVDYSNSELAQMMANDNDDFNRYQAGQNLYLNLLEGNLACLKKSNTLEYPKEFSSAFGALLKDNKIDGLFKAKCLQLPSETDLHLRQEIYDIQGTHEVCKHMKKFLAESFYDELLEIYQGLEVKESFSLSVEQMAKRSLRNTVLSYLVEVKNNESLQIALEHYHSANNMTDEFFSFAYLVNREGDHRFEVKDSFYKKWSKDSLVMLKWIGALCATDLSDALKLAKSIEKDSIYDKTVPNTFRAVVQGIARNHIHFHNIDGSGFNFVTDRILEMDKVNPQIAALIINHFDGFDHFDEVSKTHAGNCLNRIIKTPNLSKNTFEKVSKALEIRG